MTENEAQEWIVATFGGAALARLDRFVAMIRDEAPRQNLISAATMDTIWTRHIVDSAQLLNLVSTDGLWIDVGTGAGFPGVVIALLRDRPILLVEPRRRRVDFLTHVVHEFGLDDRVDIRQARIEVVSDRAAVLSARAVTSMDKLFTCASNCTDERTRWLLPKGAHALEELAHTRRTWQGTFHVEHSITDPRSMIVVGDGISHR